MGTGSSAGKGKAGSEGAGMIYENTSGTSGIQVGQMMGGYEEEIVRC